ncbi:hypothetical protein PIB30_101726 [Stylosanthes scabra]|uniref:Uncharacterized protein n=1 Tax=Stylosanthes scabra TaxID=79078 RepID=A0ABU6UX41_9FABA|nr:hypothetical protein [Stylosanthes scabra]
MTCGTSWSSFGGRRISRSSRRSTSRTGRPRRVDHFIRGAPPRSDGGWMSRAPPIDEAALWTRFAGGRKRRRIYGMGVVPSHQHPPLFPDDEDADTASAPDLRERVVMLNREISQQAEANARRVAALESTVQT